MKYVLICVATVLATSLPVQAGVQQKFTALLVKSSKSGNPSMTFLKGLGSMKQLSLNTTQVKAAVAAAPLRNPSLKRMLGAVTGVKISGNEVKISMSKATKLDLGEGWAHLGKAVSFKLNGRRLSNFKGLKLSESRSSMAVAPQSIAFSKTTATIKLGLAGTRVVALGGGAKSSKSSKTKPKKGKTRGLIGSL